MDISKDELLRVIDKVRQDGLLLQK